MWPQNELVNDPLRSCAFVISAQFNALNERNKSSLEGKKRVFFLDKVRFRNIRIMSDKLRGRRNGRRNTVMIQLKTKNTATTTEIEHQNYHEKSNKEKKKKF